MSAELPMAAPEYEQLLDNLRQLGLSSVAPVLAVGIGTGFAVGGAAFVLGSVRQVADGPEPELRWQVAEALVNQGATLSDNGRCEEATTVWDEVVRRYGEAPEPELRRLVAAALMNKGAAVSDTGRWEQAIAA